MIAYDELQISELKIENPTTSQRNPIASQHNRTASLYRTVLAKVDLMVKIFGHQPNTDSGFPE